MQASDLVILVTCAVYDLVSFKELLGKALLTLLLLVQGVGVESRAKLVVSGAHVRLLRCLHVLDP